MNRRRHTIAHKHKHAFCIRTNFQIGILEQCMPIWGLLTNTTRVVSRQRANFPACHCEAGNTSRGNLKTGLGEDPQST